MIHGFPGDNPSGVIYHEDQVAAWIGEGCDENNPFGKWYMDLTNYSTDCSKFFISKEKVVVEKPEEAIEQPSFHLPLLPSVCFEAENMHEDQLSQERINNPEQMFIYDISSHPSSRGQRSRKKFI